MDISIHYLYVSGGIIRPLSTCLLEALTLMKTCTYDENDHEFVDITRSYIHIINLVIILFSV